MNTKKLLSRVAALVLALCMMLALACTCFAADANDAINNSKSGVVEILLCYNDDVQGARPFFWGTGFLINNNTVITCDHVVNLTPEQIAYGAQKFGVGESELKNRLVIRVSVNRDVTIGATLKTSSSEMDYAILSLDSQMYDRTYLPLRTTEVNTTETVYALGFPYNVQETQDLNIYTANDVTVTSGTVSKNDRFSFSVPVEWDRLILGIRDYNNVDCIAHSAAVVSGNSGGPLLDANGAVVGINAASNETSNYNLSVRIDQLIVTLRSLGIDFTAYPSEGPIPTDAPTPTEMPAPTEAPAPAGADKTQLNAVITDAQKVDLKGYTEETVEKFNSAMDTATSVLSNENASQAQVDDAIKALSAAKLNLEETKSFPIVIIIVAVAVVVLIAIILIVVLSRGKKKKAVPAAPAYGAPAAPSPMGGFAPVNNVPVNNFAMNSSAAGGAPTSVLGGGSEGTTVLNAGSEGTTVLNAGNMGSLTRTKTGETIKINTNNFVIGKERAKVNYCVSNNTNVSRTHIRITARGGVTYVTDLGSTNGTTLNGVRMTPNQETALHSGDKITLGDEDFVYNAF